MCSLGRKPPPALVVPIEFSISLPHSLTYVVQSQNTMPALTMPLHMLVWLGVYSFMKVLFIDFILVIAGPHILHDILSSSLAKISSSPIIVSCLSLDCLTRNLKYVCHLCLSWALSCCPHPQHTHQVMSWWSQCSSVSFVFYSFHSYYCFNLLIYIYFAIFSYDFFSFSKHNPVFVF